MELAFENGGWWAYVVVFVAAAIPVLEVLVVVPAAVLAGMSPVPTALVAAAGNLCTVALVAVAGDRIRQQRRRNRDEGGKSSEDGETGRRPQRGRELARRWGVPGLAFLSPVTTGTHVGVIAALATGAERRRVLQWMAVGVSVWAGLAAVATAAGLDAFT